jgi:hypothetical protein
MFWTALDSGIGNVMCVLLSVGTYVLGSKFYNGSIWLWYVQYSTATLKR